MVELVKATDGFVGGQQSRLDARDAGRAAMDRFGLKLGMAEAAVVNDDNLNHGFPPFALQARRILT
ncbi:MAG TPA: hypothetical protein VGX78_22250 [Pirellulales bacterium]|jgi:hypothetical protein|nr:hypothetical protein [Pirellulales bacterium]